MPARRDRKKLGETLHETKNNCVDNWHGEQPYCRMVTNVALLPSNLRVRWRPRRKRLMLVTGMSGFLGRHLIEPSEIGDWELLSPSKTALDVRDRRRILDDI